MRLQGKIAFITGGNSGIGLATARLFIAEGAKVAITGRNPETLASACRELGPHAIGIHADLDDLASIEPAVAHAASTLGKIDILFANAGVSGTTPVGKTSFETFEQIIKTNVTAVFFTVQAAISQMNDHGSIILNGSVHAVLGSPGFAAYAGSKGAIRSMTRVFASEFAERGIRVNQVTPGAARTPIWNPRAPDAAAMTELEKKLATSIPRGRIGDPEEVAKVVLFLASDDSSNVLAEEIMVDGGATGAPMGASAHRGRL